MSSPLLERNKLGFYRTCQLSVNIKYEYAVNNLKNVFYIGWRKPNFYLEFLSISIHFSYILYEIYQEEYKALLNVKHGNFFCFLEINGMP